MSSYLDLLLRRRKEREGEGWVGWDGGAICDVYKVDGRTAWYGALSLHAFNGRGDRLSSESSINIELSNESCVQHKRDIVAITWPEADVGTRCMSALWCQFSISKLNRPS